MRQTLCNFVGDVEVISVQEVEGSGRGRTGTVVAAAVPGGSLKASVPLPLGTPKGFASKQRQLQGRTARVDNGKRAASFDDKVRFVVFSFAPTRN